MFRKNTAGQHVCVAAVNASTGAALTGATISVRRCLDGTFAAATGTVTEDAGGLYKFAMSQADTNANNVSLYFTATSMIPVSLSMVTTAADPTDSVRFGLTGLANATPGAAGGLVIAGSNAATTFATLTSTGAFSNNGTVDVAQTGDSFARIGAAGAGLTAITGVTLAATTGLGNQTANITGSLSGSVGSVTGLTASDVGAIKAKTDLLPAAPAAVGDIPTAVQNADALLNRDMATGTDSGSPTVRTVRQALRFLRNKWSISGTTLTVAKEDDITASWTSTVSTNAAADPIVGNDPA